LVEPVNPKLIFPCGDVAALAEILRNCLREREEFAQAGQRAKKRMGTWSIRENVAGHVEAIQIAVARVRRQRIDEASGGL
jgi:hypothetical protein